MLIINLTSLKSSLLKSLSTNGQTRTCTQRDNLDASFLSKDCLLVRTLRLPAVGVFVDSGVIWSYELLRFFDTSRFKSNEPALGLLPPALLAL